MLTVPSVSQSAQVSMLADLNATRARAGLPQLQLDSRLSEVAREHAYDMVAHNYFDHQSPDGRSPFQRMRSGGCAYSWAGENLALSSDERSAYHALLNSAPHLQNIMQAHFAKVGIAAVREADGQMIFVQDFTD